MVVIVNGYSKPEFYAGGFTVFLYYFYHNIAAYFYAIPVIAQAMTIKRIFIAINLGDAIGG